MDENKNNATYDQVRTTTALLPNEPEHIKWYNTLTDRLPTFVGWSAVYQFKHVLRKIDFF